MDGNRAYPTARCSLWKYTLEYNARQWYYLPTHNYGGPKLDDKRIAVKSVHISKDRRKIFLEMDGLQPEHVVYLKLPSHWTSNTGQVLWSTEAWYTLNNIPANQLGFNSPPSAVFPLNQLSDAERKEGWELLFDGKSTKGWHTFGKKGIGSSWKIEAGASCLMARQDGGWQAQDGGDIVTDQEFENFELRLEWKIAPCGNSGIMFNGGIQRV
ncbi:MAG: DUF1080 domain-containing protein [Saprospiraceae bacterium]